MAPRRRADGEGDQTASRRRLAAASRINSQQGHDRWPRAETPHRLLTSAPTRTITKATHEIAIQEMVEFSSKPRRGSTGNRHYQLTSIAGRRGDSPSSLDGKVGVNREDAQAHLQALRRHARPARLLTLTFHKQNHRSRPETHASRLNA